MSDVPLKEFVLKFFTYHGVVNHMLQDEEGSAWMMDRADEWRKRLMDQPTAVDLSGKQSSPDRKLREVHNQNLVMASFLTQRWNIEVHWVIT